jgi:hypothetical protein
VPIKEVVEMKKRLLVMALVIAIALATAVPVFASHGPGNACHSGHLRGIFDPANPALVHLYYVTFSGGGVIQAELKSGTRVTLIYDEGDNNVDFFQCPQDPDDGDDTIIDIQTSPPQKP